jgi:hypothetical protein
VKKEEPEKEEDFDELLYLCAPGPEDEKPSAKVLTEAEEKATLEKLWIDLNPGLTLRERMFEGAFGEKLEACHSFLENQPLDIAN